jgi:hypothetical protein
VYITIEEHFESFLVAEEKQEKWYYVLEGKKLPVAAN